MKRDFKELPPQICNVCEPKFFEVNWYEPLCKFQKIPKCPKGKEHIKKKHIKEVRKKYYDLD